MLGSHIKHFRVTKKLGEGGMGVVYLAEDTRLGREVALKFLPSHITVTEEDRQRLEQEARAAARLNHPNICTIYSFDEHEGQPFLAMEYIEGTTLRERLREGPLPVDEALDYALQIAEALSKAHEAGIIHRDVKPGNIMVNTEGRVKVMDFGLAKLKGTDALTRTGSTVGTMAYMAPEQIQSREVDHRADIFAFGVVLFEMLTARRPFRGEHQAALVYSIVNEDPAPLQSYLPKAPKELTEMFDGLLAKNPEARYPSAADVVSALEGIRMDAAPDETSRVRDAAVQTQQDNVSAPQIARPSSTGKNTTFTINIPSFKNSPVAFIGLLGGILFLFGVGYFLFAADRVPETAGNSIAVLPFESASDDPDDIQLVRGVHEDIINQLSNIQDLRVIARSSVIDYAPGDRNLARIVDELGVATILEGSVWHVDDRIRVSTRLIDAETNENLWAGTFDRQLDDILNLRTEIALELAGELHASLTAVERERIDQRPTDNPEAYTFFMRAREYHSRGIYQEGNFESAERLYQRALDLDPQFALAHAYLSEANAEAYWFVQDRTPERIEKAREHAERALELDPDLPEAHRAMGLYFYWGHRDYDRALEYAETARQHIPNDPSLHTLIAAVQRRLGLFDEALENFQTVLELDPRNGDTFYQVGLQHIYTRDFPAAVEMLDRAIDLAPDVTVYRIDRATSFVYSHGTVDSLLTLFDEIDDLSPYSRTAWMRTHLWNRDWDGLIAAAQTLPAVIETQDLVTAQEYFVGTGWEEKGEPERAVEYYDTARVVLEALRDERPDDPRIRAGLGRVYAALGKRDDAIREGRRATELVPLEHDALDGPQFKIQLASIYARVDEEEHAIALLEEVLSIPSYLTPQLLRVEHDWDPLRDHPRFQELLSDS